MKITADVRFSTVPEWIIYADVSAQAVRLWAVLDRHADKTGRAVPGQTRLAKLMHCSTSNVQRAIADLERIGAVSVKRGKTASGEKAVNEYTLHVLAGQSSPPVGVPAPAGHGSPPVTQERKPLNERTPERERDPAFDALAEETGSDLKALTRSDARKVGVKLAEIAEAEGNRRDLGASAPHDEALAQEIRYRAERYRRLHPDWQLTAPSLAMHWATLGTRPLPNGRAPTVTELRAAIPDDQYDPGEPISEQYARLKRERAGEKT